MAKRGHHAVSCCADILSASDRESKPKLRRMRSRSFDDTYLKAEAPDTKRKLHQFIVLGGASMQTDPEDVLRASLKDTDLPLRQPISKVFGNWRFDYSDIASATWEASEKTVQRNLATLRAAGSIRYCSWIGKRDELRAVDTFFEEADTDMIAAELFEGSDNPDAAEETVVEENLFETFDNAVAAKDAEATDSNNQADAKVCKEDFDEGVGQKVSNASNYFAQPADALQRL